MSYDQRTDWYPAATKPVRAGWYEARRFTLDNPFHMYWTGSAWEYHGAKPKARRPAFGSLFGDAWRGLAAEPIAVQRSNSLDVTGQRYGRLVATHRAFMSGQGSHWAFECDCGRSRVARLKDVRLGNTASCGCGQFEKGTVKVNRPWAKSQDPDFFVKHKKKVSTTHNPLLIQDFSVI